MTPVIATTVTMDTGTISSLVFQDTYLWKDSGMRIFSPTQEKLECLTNTLTRMLDIKGKIEDI